jgi:hypothetical protein
MLQLVVVATPGIFIYLWNIAEGDEVSACWRRCQAVTWRDAFPELVFCKYLPGDVVFKFFSSQTRRRSTCAVYQVQYPQADGGCGRTTAVYCCKSLSSGRLSSG